MSWRISEKQEQAILLARAPLIFFWAEQLKAARDAIDAFYDENGSGLWDIVLGLSFLATPTYWELRERVEWCVAKKSLGHASRYRTDSGRYAGTRATLTTCFTSLTSRSEGSRISGVKAHSTSFKAHSATLKAHPTPTCSQQVSAFQLATAMSYH